jgi:hypothetical protein
LPDRARATDARVLGFIDILSRSALLLTNGKVEVLTLGTTFGMKGIDFERDLFCQRWYLLLHVLHNKPES